MCMFYSTMLQWNPDRTHGTKQSSLSWSSCGECITSNINKKCKKKGLNWLNWLPVLQQQMSLCSTWWPLIPKHTKKISLLRSRCLIHFRQIKSNSNFMSACLTAINTQSYISGVHVDSSIPLRTNVRYHNIIRVFIGNPPETYSKWSHAVAVSICAVYRSFYEMCYTICLFEINCDEMISLSLKLVGMDFCGILIFRNNCMCTSKVANGNDVSKVFYHISSQSAQQTNGIFTLTFRRCYLMDQYRCRSCRGWCICFCLEYVTRYYMASPGITDRSWRPSKLMHSRV